MIKLVLRAAISLPFLLVAPSIVAAGPAPVCRTSYTDLAVQIRAEAVKQELSLTSDQLIARDGGLDAALKKQRDRVTATNRVWESLQNQPDSPAKQAIGDGRVYAATVIEALECRKAQGG